MKFFLKKKILICLKIMMLVSMPVQAVEANVKDGLRVALGSLVLVGAWESLKRADAAWDKANTLPTMAQEQILKIGARTRVGKASQVLARMRKKLLGEPEPTPEQRKQQLAADNIAIFIRRFGPFIAWTATTIALTVGGVKLISKALL